jgi:bifunctional dethiobiotin synthetase / adenosylmethionine---8-amino-7-oxononanoate aminotransferase
VSHTHMKGKEQSGGKHNKTRDCKLAREKLQSLVMTRGILKRWFTTTSSLSATNVIPTHLRRHIIFGSNTDVGKTVVSAGLVRASSPASHYIKPLQCGGSDQAFVEKYSLTENAQTIFRWETPASPHDACRIENSPKSDNQVVDALNAALLRIDAEPTWVETAGGVLSPSTASPLNQLPKHAVSSNSWGWTTQADVYQPFLGAATVVLVGDGRLGGISATLSSLESLLCRGYDVAGLILIETPPYGNLSALRDYASRKLKLGLGTGRALFEHAEESILSLPPLPPMSEPLYGWYESAQVSDAFAALNRKLEDEWKIRLEE